ncbi:MAG: 3'-5' exonuclease, partial [Eggerthellaceae bacterium]
FKAIRIVESIEQDGACGPSSVAFALSAHIATAKEAPGALSAQGGDFVRIMTVHASKGLEFPIVAVAEMGSSRARSSSFSCSVIEGVAYVGLSPSRSLSGFSSSSPVVKAMDKKYGVGLDENAACEEGSVEAIRRACSPMARREAVRSYEAEQDLQERRRLLYVALTRAKEALVFSMASVRSGADADERE